MRRKRGFLGVVLVGVVCVFCPGVAEAQRPNEQPADLSNINWQVGPGRANLGTIAEIQLPQDYRFVGPDDARLLSEAIGNPTDGSELGFVAASSFGPPFGSPKDQWFVVFEFNPLGYVKDGEKDSLDADAMLQAIREGNALANKERQRRGW